MKEFSNTSKIGSLLLIRKNYLLSRIEKPKKVMKYLMQIKVGCFGVAYRVKVKDIIEMQSG